MNARHSPNQTLPLIQVVELDLHALCNSIADEQTHCDSCEFKTRYPSTSDSPAYWECDVENEGNYLDCPGMEEAIEKASLEVEGSDNA